MPISQERLAKILQHHQQSGLMSSDGDRYMSQIQESKGSGMGLVDPDPSSYDNDGFGDDLWLSGADTSKPSTSYTDSYGGRAETSQMPDAIKKSMMEHRIDTSALGGKSVTEQLGLKPIAKKQITEVQQKQAQQQATGQIDYSIIKAIIKDCLDEELKDLKSGGLKTIGLSQGKIKLVDNKGNIFTADLVLKGNVNDKKK